MSLQARCRQIEQYHNMEGGGNETYSRKLEKSQGPDGRSMKDVEPWKEA